MEQKPKAYVKTKYQNYYHNNKKSKLPDKLHTNILSPEYKQYLKLQEYLKTHKKIKNELKLELQHEILKFKLQLAKYNLTILQKYNPNYKLKAIGSNYYITKEV